LIKSATLNWKQIPIVLVVMVLFGLIWVVLLRVGIRADGKLSLNATDMGSIEDPSKLASRLAEIFTACAEAGVAERSVTVSAGDEVEYGEVAKLVDFLTGAGAGPIVMQLDAHIPIGSKPRRDSAGQ
jgi:hypothetical protein